MEGLATEICNMVPDLCVDAVGISEVFNLKDQGLQQRQDIMQHVVSKLNSRAARPATSADSSAAQPAWAGQSDGHYIFVWNTSKLLQTVYNYVSCGIKEQPWRMAQYLQFQCAESQDGLPLHVCHCHSPSSDNANLTDARRKLIFRTLWAHVMQNDSSSGSQPVSVFGGDFNCKALQWVQCLKGAMDTEASRRSVQTCTSKAIPLHHGDRAIVFNAFAAQENSGWGKSHIRDNEPLPFSDGHDVVLVPIYWSQVRATETHASSSAARPASPASSDYAATQPQIIEPSSPRNRESPPDSPQPIESAMLSNPEPTNFGNVDAAPSLIVPSPETPLYNALLDKLATTDDEEVMESLADFGVFDKLKFKKPYGSAEQPADKMDNPYQLALRIEHLLTVTNTQRSNHIARLASRNDVRAQTPHALVFTSADMKDTMNAWRKQPDMWSNSLQTIQNLQTTQECHLDVKSKFNTMLFQLFGCKPLVEIFIRFPICCAEQPAPLLKNFAHAWRSFRNSPEANSARKISQPNMPGEVRLSKQIYALEQRRVRGKWIAEWIEEDRNNWYQLNHADQLLWTDYQRRHHAQYDWAANEAAAKVSRGR